MTYTGTVVTLDDQGDQVHVKLTNVRRANSAEWVPYSPNLTVGMSHKQAWAFPIGRAVVITVKPKRTR